MRKRQRKSEQKKELNEDCSGECECGDLVGLTVQTREGRMGVIVNHDPDDSLL